MNASKQADLNMNFKNTKTAKAVSGIVSFATAIMMIAPATVSAATVEELTAQINALLAQVSALKATTGNTTTTTTSGYQFSKDLTVGSKGDDVTALQTTLVSKGYLTMPAGVAMGYFGAATKAAVMKWQAAAGISPVAGYVGAKSRAALNAMSTSSTTSSTTTTTTTTTTTGTGTGVVASLDTTSPAAGVIIAGQSVAKLAAFKIMNNNATPAKVTAVKLTRTGVSSDSTITNIYLYNGAQRITDAAAVSSGKISFSDASGIVTIPAMSSVTIWARADIAASTNGQTLGVMLTDVTADGVSVTGTPVSGAQMTIAATPSGITTADWTGTTLPAVASIDPSNDYVMWQQNLSVGSRDALLSTIRFRQIGSVNAGDLTNFRLLIDGVQQGTAVVSVDASNYVTFDFSAAPITLKAGTRVVKLLGDMVGGSNRTFQFSLRQAGDAELWDSQLLVTVLPTVSSSSFSALSSGIQTVNQGTISITKATDSLSGNVTLGGSGIALAKFSVRAAGEKLKVESLRISHTADSNNWAGIRNGALFLNGVQIGSTATINEDGQSPAYTQFNLGSAMILNPGVTSVLEVRGDVYNTSGSAVVAASTTVINIAAGSSNVQRMTSLNYISNTAVSGNTLTVASGSLGLAKYSAYANQTVVPPQTAYKVGEFRVTSGATEPVTLSTIGVDFTASTISAAHLTDLYVAYGPVGGTMKMTTLKSTISSLTSSSTWSVNETVPTNANYVFAVYGTLSSSASGAIVSNLDVSGTGANSGNTVDSGGVAGQTITTGAGSIIVANDASTPVSAQLVAGTLAKIGSFKFTTSNDSFTIDEIALKATSTAGAAAITNYEFKDGATVLKDQPMSGVYATATGLSIVIPANSNKVIDLYAQLGNVGTGYASTSVDISTVMQAFEYINSNGVKTRTYGASTFGATTTNRMFVYKTKPTITNVALPSTVLTTGTQTVFKFTVTADAGGTVAWRQIKLSYATSGSTVFNNDSYLLYDAANESTALTVTVATTTTGVTFTSTTDREISGSKTYTVKANITGSIASGSSMSHNFPSSGLGYVASAPYSSVGVSSAFIWSDESSQPHDNTTQDWNNDYLVKNLPTDSLSMTK